jgi:hypothetical protein
MEEKLFLERELEGGSFSEKRIDERCLYRMVEERHPIQWVVEERSFLERELEGGSFSEKQFEEGHPMQRVEEGPP